MHCAAGYTFGAGQSSELSRVNVDGTKAVLTAAASAGVGRAVVTSSAITWAPVRHRSCATSPIAAVMSPRHTTIPKVAQEQVALEIAERKGIPVILALPSLVLGGPYARLGPSNAIVLRYLLDPTRSTFAGGANVVDAPAIGRGHLLLLQSGQPGERYLLGGDNVTWRMLHELIAQLTGLPGPHAEATPLLTWTASALAEGWAHVMGHQPLLTREEALTVGRYYWYTSGKAAALGYQPGTARQAVAASLAGLVIGKELPRWVREGLRLDPDVRAARELVPSRSRPDSHPGGI